MQLITNQYHRSFAEPHQLSPGSGPSVSRAVRFTVETARLRMETNIPTAPWAAFSRIMLYWGAFTAVLFHNTGRHAALWELPIYDSKNESCSAFNDSPPNKFRDKCTGCFKIKKQSVLSLLILECPWFLSQIKLGVVFFFLTWRWRFIGDLEGCFIVFCLLYISEHISSHPWKNCGETCVLSEYYSLALFSWGKWFFFFLF